MFNQRKNKRFTYNSRFKGDKKTLESEKTFKFNLTSEWQSARRTGSGNRKLSSLSILLILLAVIIAVMYYLDGKLR